MQYTINIDEAKEKGISKTTFYKYVSDSGYEKVSPGVYASPDAIIDSLALVHKRCPQGIISHNEALYHYGLIDREPLQTTITIYSGYNKTRLQNSGYKVYTVKKELLELGKTFVEDLFGNTVPMYDIDRTICDLVRSRSNFEAQNFMIAIKTYAKRPDKNLGNLFEYAEKFKIEKILRKYMEILL